MDGVLRVVAGPNVGACFVLGARTRIGRAVDAHIQLDESHVSRHHARIVRLEDGGFELSDLGSRVGTTVNGEPTQHRRLEADDVIAIGRSRFAFEYTVGEVTAKGFERKSRGFNSLRPTQPLPAVPLAVEPELLVKRTRRRTTQRKIPAMRDTSTQPAPPKKPERVKLSLDMPFVPAQDDQRQTPESLPVIEADPRLVESVDHPPLRPEAEAPKRVIEPPPAEAVAGVRTDGPAALLDAILGPEVDAVVSKTVEAANEDSGPTPAAAPSEPAAAVEAVQAVPRDTVVAGSGPLEVDPDAREAALKVLRDVLDYRALRLDDLRGEPLGDRQRARFEQLTVRLLVDTHGLPASRRFVRVPCTLPATLTQCDGRFSRTLDVVLDELSAGGARLSMHDPAVRVGDEVWLAFDLAALFSFGQKVVFRSRVVWTSGRLGATGLMFGGNARFVDTVENAIATG